MIAGAFGFDYVMIVISAAGGNKTTNSWKLRNHQSFRSKRNNCSSYKKKI